MKELGLWLWPGKLKAGMISKLLHFHKDTQQLPHSEW